MNYRSDRACVAIIAGEASGDQHGARLVTAMQKKSPAIFFCGIGGSELRQVGVEVHGANEDGRLVVTVEQPGEKGLSDVLDQMQSMPGILSTSLIYHQFEDLAHQEDGE